MESLDIVPGISEVTSWPGSSHIRLGSVKPQSKLRVPTGDPAAEPDSSPLLKAKPVEPVSFYPCLWPPADYHIDIGFRQRDGDGFGVCGTLDMQTVILDVWSWGKGSCLPIFLCVSYFLISVTKLWDLIVRLCMCKGRTHHVNVLETESLCKTAKTFSFILQVTAKWQSKSNISEAMSNQNLSDWCHTCHGNSGQWAWRIDLNDNRYAAFIHLSNCITSRTDLVHMTEIFEIACDTSWKSRRRSWIAKGEEVELYLPKTSEMIYMPSISGRKRGNVIGPRHFTLRYRR